MPQIFKKPNYIKSLIEKGENQYLDFKFAVNNSQKIAISLSAFANAKGGKLLLGVNDNGSIAGIKSDEEFFMIEKASKLYTSPIVKFESKQHLVEGKIVLEIIVPESDNKPHFAMNQNEKFTAFIRIKDQNIIANDIIFQVLQTQNQEIGIKITYTESEKILLIYISENKTITLNKFCRIAEIPNFKAKNIIINFILLKIIDYVYIDNSFSYFLIEKDIT